MRKTLFIAAALSAALAGCNSGGGASNTASDAKPGNATGAEAEKPAKTAASGKWDVDSKECIATKDFGDSGLKIQQTSSALNVYFWTAWSPEVKGPVTVGDDKMDPSSVPEDGKDWIMVSRPNEDFGGLHDGIENSQSLTISYESYKKTFSLAGSNGVMDKLRKCAGL